MEAALDAHRRFRGEAGVPGHARMRRRWRRLVLRLMHGLPSLDPRLLFGRRHPVLRRAAIAAAISLTVVFSGGGLLWWRLLSGPIALDLATPWLTSAVEQNFGNRYRVEVGGTVLERDENGRTALRIRNIVVKNSNGAVVANAPSLSLTTMSRMRSAVRPFSSRSRMVPPTSTE